MNTTNKPTHIDLGKWMGVIAFSCVLYWNFTHAGLLVKYLFPISALKALVAINYMLTASFLILVIYLYIRRSAAKTTTRSLPAKFIAVFAFILPCVIPFFGHVGRIDLVMLAISNVVTGAGLAFGLAALYALGSSFSIIPQTRNLVVKGPYRLVRHPIYVGEIVSYIGIALVAFSIQKALLVLLFILCQVYRSIQEEKLLSETFPEYQDYAGKTARFIPGLV